MSVLGAERIDLHALTADIPECRDRGCIATYMEPLHIEAEDGLRSIFDAWRVLHRTRKLWAQIPVSVEMVQDEQTWSAFLPHLIKQAHEVMDRLVRESGHEPA